ncbi:MAG: NUDIX domain-containing protein [Alphaproteobacteria bacterium]|nr:NUDIX domain-containing protein [Alphaproteobacteria bacterium]
MQILKDLEVYKPYDEVEAEDIKSMKQFLKAFGEFGFLRECLPAHMTTIVWVVNPERTKVLMGYHNIYQVFTWFGGHADGEFNLLENAKTELTEETGISNYKILNSGKPFDYSSMHVQTHLKHGKRVTEHLHFNATYLFEVPEDEKFRIAEGENSAISWIDVKDLHNHCDCEIVGITYKRLMDKIYKQKL